MNFSEPSFFEKLARQVFGIIPIEFRIQNWNTDRLKSEKSKLAAVVLLRSREGKNNSADLKKLRLISEEISKRENAQTSRKFRKEIPQN